MKSIITNAAEITVLRLIDNTFKTGGGPVSVGATAIVASKGPVGVVTQVRDDNLLSYFGNPLPKRSSNMEGIRHLIDAAKNCNYINTVRVVHDDARFPSATVSLISDHGAWAHDHVYAAGDYIENIDIGYICTTAHTASATTFAPVDVAKWDVMDSTIQAGESTPGVVGHPYGTALSLGAGNVMQIWPIDGDPSINRSVEIANVITEKGNWAVSTPYKVNDVVTVTGGSLITLTAHTSSATVGEAPTLAIPTANWKAYKGQYDKRFTLNIYDKDENAVEYLLETYLVGIAPTDKDDMGRPAFIETVLEQNSERFRCNIDEDLTWAAVLDSLKHATKTAFTGGTNGSDPVTADWIKAWDLFRNETFRCNLMFAAGNYDADVLANCIDIADERHCSFFFDVNPNLSADAAIAWIKGTGLESRQSAVYYSPFAASDRFYGGKTVWGVSGAAANACAIGDANMTGAIPGIHYAPAGIYRGMLERTGVKALFPEDVINRDDFYDARINPVVAGDTGGAMIDDALSLHYKQNYSRFIWVNRIANYIDHRFIEAARYAKFEPDGLTRAILARLTKEILDQLITSGALVTPRDTADGNMPYKLVVKQEEIDLWLVTWDFCPTGAARRIAGQPRLIK